MAAIDYVVPTTGTANNYSCVITTAQDSSDIFHVQFNVTNTGASTLTVTNGTSTVKNAVAIRKWDGSAWVALSGSELDVSTIYKVSYNDVGGTYFQLQSFGAGGGGSLSLGETSTTAYRGDRGKTAYDHSQLTTGNPHNVTAAQVGAVGLQDLYIPAVAMWPRTTNPCADLAKTEISTSLVNIQSLDFDQTSSEYAQFTISLPKNWNNGTVTAKFYWTAAGGSGTVTWGIQGGAYSDDDALSTALGTAQTVTDTLITANDLHISAATSAITLAGSPADADFLAFQIYRDISDSLSADAKLLGVVIQLTTDAAISS